MSLSFDLEKAKEYLDGLEGVREEMIKRSRDIVNMCRAIVNKTLLGEDVDIFIQSLQQKYQELYNLVKSFPELMYSNSFYSTVVEYVEALQFYNIAQKRRVLTIEEMNVHPIPYLLGLVEVIGELKRLSLNLLKKDMFEEAFNYLEVAEAIYDKLTSLSYPDAVLPGFRRKLDIYRKVLDDWKKFLIDMESRRKLIHKLNQALKQVKGGDYKGVEG